MDMEVRDLSEEETWVLEETKIRLRQLEDFHQRDLKQKSRSNWAKYGDDNTRYFHGCINKRRAANHLPGLMLRGIWETILTLIKREVLRFFRNKLRESLSVRPYLCGHGFKKLSDEDAEGLVRVISLQEINEAVYGCGADKAPGPDGFNFRFLRTFWISLSPILWKLCSIFISLVG
ncbi:putative RNA-directed DNA polymerase [Helianthus annuus]|nr:putative RNA-directed DNA polymerase [Helianthus annuus]